jgi:pimeloyl-ACP methyl ester carboxylesterase
VRIAYAEVGQGRRYQGRQLAQPSRIRLGKPDLEPLLHTTRRRASLIRYDARGNGLSDWDVEDISFDAFVRDLETVVEATDVSASRLFGISQGLRRFDQYAVRIPNASAA